MQDSSESRTPAREFTATIGDLGNAAPSPELAEQEEAIRLLLVRVLQGPLAPLHQHLSELSAKASTLDAKVKAVQGYSANLTKALPIRLDDLAHSLDVTLKTLDEAVGLQGASSEVRHAQATTAIAAMHATMLECGQSLASQSQKLREFHDDVSERFNRRAAWHDERSHRDEQIVKSNAARIDALLEAQKRLSVQAHRETSQSIELLANRLDDLGAAVGRMEDVVTRVVLARVRPGVRLTQWLVVATGALAAAVSIVIEHLWNHAH